MVIHLLSISIQNGVNRVADVDVVKNSITISISEIKMAVSTILKQTTREQRLKIPGFPPFFSPSGR